MVYYKQEKFILAEFHFKKALAVNPYNSALLCTVAVVSIDSFCYHFSLTNIITASSATILCFTACLLADRTATQHDRLLASSCRP